jgi:leucyl-tRNA synthetase
MDPKNEEMPFDPDAEKYWGPVDLYVGGVEHAVLHLLYARFWHKVLYDCGLVHTKEPFKKLFNQGMILGVSHRDEKGKYYSPNDVENRNGVFYLKGTDTALASREEKMSKSKLNVINPDDVINAYGADSLRLYEMFMGPLDAVKPWQMNGVKGVYSFLDRSWSLIVDPNSGGLNAHIQDVPESSASKELLRELHATISKVTSDIENLKFNTAIAKMMEFMNVAKKQDVIPVSVVEQYVKLLSPFAPHAAEELWSRLGHDESLTYQPWPIANETYLQSQQSTISVHFNGKKRSLLTVDTSLTEDEVSDIVRTAPETESHFKTGTVKRVVYVPNKMINFIIG